MMSISFDDQAEMIIELIDRVDSMKASDADKVEAVYRIAQGLLKFVFEDFIVEPNMARQKTAEQLIKKIEKWGGIQ